jgi:hypothetical protein
MARSRGYLISLYGAEDVVSAQFDLLPSSPCILKLGSVSRTPTQRDIDLTGHQDPDQISSLNWSFDCYSNLREEAQQFFAAGSPGEVGIVFVKGRLFRASTECSDSVTGIVPSGGDTEAYVYSKTGNGTILVEGDQQQLDKPDDLTAIASNGAQGTDERAARVKPDPAYQCFLSSKNDEQGVEVEDTSIVDDTTLATFLTATHSSSWENQSDGHTSGRISVAHKVSFQHARLIPVPTSNPSYPLYKGDDGVDFTTASDDNIMPPRAVCAARRQEALRLLEGEAVPDIACELTLPLREDMAILVRGDLSSITPGGLRPPYSGGDLRTNDIKQHSDSTKDGFLELLTTNYRTAIELQNDIRATLREWLWQRHPAWDLTILRPMLDRSILPNVSRDALAFIEERVDLILAVGCQDGIDRRSYQSVVDQLLKLGRPDGKTYSRAGEIEFKGLLTELMVAHTSKPLLLQTCNPFESDLTTAEVVLPQIAAHLSSQPQTRFLVIDVAERHFPTVVALRAMIGLKKFRIAAVVNYRLSLPYSAPIPTSPSAVYCHGELEALALTQVQRARNPFKEANWTMVAGTSSTLATERLNLTVKVWRVLREASAWYNPGIEEEESGAYGNRISIAVTTEDRTNAPRVARAVSIAKRPKGYETGRSNLSRPLVPVSPASPPDSISASPDHSAPDSVIASYVHAWHFSNEPDSRLPPRPNPVSPEPTISSYASSNSGSAWQGLTQKLKKSFTSTVFSDDPSKRLATKLSGLVRPATAPKPQNVSRYNPSTSCVLRYKAHVPRRRDQARIACTSSSSHLRHRLVKRSVGEEAAATEGDASDDRGDGKDMDLEERRLLGRLGSEGRRNEDGKARRMLGLV